MVKEHAKLMDLVLAIPGSRAQIAIHLHALMVMLQHATIREHVLLEFALALLEVHLIVSN